MHLMCQIYEYLILSVKIDAIRFESHFMFDIFVLFVLLNCLRSCLVTDLVRLI